MSEDLQRKIQTELDSFKKIQKGKSLIYVNITSLFVRFAEGNFYKTAVRWPVK